MSTYLHLWNCGNSKMAFTVSTHTLRFLDEDDGHLWKEELGVCSVRVTFCFLGYPLPLPGARISFLVLATDFS